MRNPTDYVLLYIFWIALFGTLNLLLYKHIFHSKSLAVVLLWVASWGIQVYGCSLLWFVSLRVLGDNYASVKGVSPRGFEDSLSAIALGVWGSLFIIANVILYKCMARLPQYTTCFFLWLISFVFQPFVCLILWAFTFILVLPG
jgi:hypothetical protein